MKDFDYCKAKAGDRVITSSGKKARIICFDADNAYPIIALVDYDGSECINRYTTDGKFSQRGMSLSADLKMAPKVIKHSYWVNLYASGWHGPLRDSKEEANRTASIHRVECREITWETEE